VKDKSSQGIALDEKAQEQPADKDRAQKAHKSEPGHRPQQPVEKDDEAVEGEERFLGLRRLPTAALTTCSADVTLEDLPWHLELRAIYRARCPTKTKNATRKKPLSRTPTKQRARTAIQSTEMVEPSISLEAPRYVERTTDLTTDTGCHVEVTAPLMSRSRLPATVSAQACSRPGS
jgi:hypothetical protein